MVKAINKKPLKICSLVRLWYEWINFGINNMIIIVKIRYSLLPWWMIKGSKKNYEKIKRENLSDC